MAKKNSLLAAPSKTVDPTLDALFASSAGPVKEPPKSRYVAPLPSRSRDSPEPSDDEEDEEEDEENDSGEEDDDSSDDNEEEETSSLENESEEEDGGTAVSEDEEDQAAAVLEAVVDHSLTNASGDRKRKRKKRDDGDDIEVKYLQKLADDDEPAEKRQKGEAAQKVENGVGASEDVGMSDDDGEVPVHESLAAGPVGDLARASRTVYISNVSTEAVKSAKAKKTLLAHLESVLDKKADPPQTIESIRFRSIPFATAGIPKRAAFIKKNVMDATTKAANAYVIYSDAAGSRAACSKLNGTVVLDRHIRVDSVAHPAAVDHRRCVFVGNLGFVDDESVLNTKVDEEGKEVTEKRKRIKAPMDVEEGLWRVFGKNAGRVESVRVVRDPVTRVGKGFAYVQFYDGTSVEAALLLAGKKFPPMLPRELRVTRCRAPQKTARALEVKNRRAVGALDKKKRTQYVPKPTAEAKTLAGRAGKLLGRSGAVQFKGRPGKDKKRGKPRPEGQADGAQNGEAEGKTIKTPEEIVFEGRRASAKDGKPRDLKFKCSKSGGQKKGGKKSHTGQRAQKWKADSASKK